MRLRSRRSFLRTAGWLPVVLPLLRRPWRPPVSCRLPQMAAGLPSISDLERIAAVLKGATPLTWVFTGDSITQAAHHTYGRQGYVEVFEERVRWELRRIRDIVVNAGVNGSNTSELLADFGWRVARFQPAVVSLFFGTNDCQAESIPPERFSSNLETLVGRIRAIGAIPLIQTPNAIADDAVVRAAGLKSRSRLPVYVDVIRSLAEREKLALVDHWRRWTDAAVTGSDYRQWLDDPLHPGADGHVEIAREIFRQLSIYDPAAFTCSGIKH